MKTPLLIVGLLLFGVGANVTLAIAAMHAPGSVVEDHYYERAMHWDEHQALRARSCALGWQVEVASTHPLALLLRDKAGRPINDASVSAQGFRMLGTEAPAGFTFVARAGGAYASPASLDHPGVWRFAVTVVRNNQTFITDLTVDVPRK